MKWSFPPTCFGWGCFINCLLFIQQIVKKNWIIDIYPDEISIRLLEKQLLPFLSYTPIFLNEWDNLSQTIPLVVTQAICYQIYYQIVRLISHCECPWVNTRWGMFLWMWLAKSITHGTINLRLFEFYYFMYYAVFLLLQILIK